MKRSPPPKRKIPLRRSTTPIRRRIPVRAKTRDATAAELLALNEALVHRRSRWRCEADVEGVCTGDAGDHPHHVRLRSRGGDDSVTNLLDVCPECHAWIHAHPAEAKRRGLMRSAWGPATT